MYMVIILNFVTQKTGIANYILHENRYIINAFSLMVSTHTLGVLHTVVHYSELMTRLI